MSPKVLHENLQKIKAITKDSSLKTLLNTRPKHTENKKHKQKTRPEFKPFSSNSSKSASYNAVEVSNQPPVPKLANSLDRVLFNGGGVYFLKDPRTNVYNFDHRLERIMSITDFDFKKIPAYIPASKDTNLAQMAARRGFQYTGSTSSLTGVLTQLHHAFSHLRPPQIVNVSKYFRGMLTSFTATQRAPAVFWVTETEVNGTKVNAITQAGEHTDMILSILGHSMEAMLTTGCTEFESFKKDSGLDVDEAKSTYNYTSCGKFLMRSQLDCYDPRLPGTGMFDLKTRACCAVRHDLDYAQIHDGSNYQILKLNGQFESFEREYFELVRSTMFKYSLQARIGRMDGIFVAYHNIRKLFGFQYLPLTEIDKVFHGSQEVIEFKDRKTSALNVDDEVDLESHDLESRLKVATHIADNEFVLSMNLLSDLIDELRGKVLADAQFIAKVNEQPVPRDLCMAVHCTGADQLTVAVYAGNANSEAGISFKHEEMPQKMRIFKVELSQFINNTYIRQTEYPSPHFNDEWRYEGRIRELFVLEAREAYQKLRESKAQQVLVSEPQLEEPATKEMIESILAKLPEANKQQKLLRAFEKRGGVYHDWDEGRPKQVCT